MSDEESDDETEGAIDLSLPTPETPTLKPYSRRLLGSPDKQQQEKGVSPHPKIKLILRVPKKRPFGATSETQDEEQFTRLIRYIPTSSNDDEVLSDAALTDPSPGKSGDIGNPNKLSQQQFMKPDKPRVKSVSRAVKTQHQSASTSKLPSPKASTAVDAATKLPTPLTSTSKASTSKLPSSNASTPEVHASKLPTPLASTSKASTSKASTSQASTSKASTSKASTSKASTSKASTSKASTSKAPTLSRELKALQYYTLGFKGRSSYPMSGKGTSMSLLADSGSDGESSFWTRTANTKFGSNEFREYLRNSNFSERQAESLQKLLQNIAQKMNNAINNSDRLVKTHKCNNCKFTICHQCVCLFYLPVPVPVTDTPEVIRAEETVICICNFAFFHTHCVDSSRLEVVNTASVEPKQQPPTRKSNIATIRCSACDMIVLIEHPPEQEVENTLIQWSAVESSNEQEFHASITAHLQRLSVAPLTFDEMSMCTNTCCLLFHRCGD